MDNLTLKVSRKNKKSPEISRLMFFMKSTNVKSIDIEDKTEVSKRTVDNFIHSDLPIGAHLLRELHAKYGVSIDWLVSGIGEMLIPGHETSEPSANYQVINQRTIRLHNFIDGFMKSSNEDEQAWLEVQLKFNIPPYRDFLESDDE